MDPSTSAIDQSASGASSGVPVPPENRQFSLAQLLAMVFACGVFLAMARVIYVGEPPLIELILLMVAWIVAAALFAFVKLRLAAQVSVIFAAFVLFLTIWFQTVPIARSAARRSVCQGHLKLIVVALHSYHDDYGCFPPAAVRDESGRPMHSWRVLLLPYLEERNLYTRYRFDEPWDGPNNRKLHGIEMPTFVCPEHARSSKPSTDTCYVVVAGPRTAFPEDRCVRLSDITDDHGSTLLVVEIHNSGIHWMEPRDLHVTQMSRQINPRRGQGISSPHPGGANAVMVDGSLRFLTNETPPSTLERLLTIAGGDKVEWER